MNKEIKKMTPEECSLLRGIQSQVIEALDKGMINSWDSLEIETFLKDPVKSLEVFIDAPLRVIKEEIDKGEGLPNPKLIQSLEKVSLNYLKFKVATQYLKENVEPPTKREIKNNEALHKALTKNETQGNGLVALKDIEGNTFIVPSFKLEEGGVSILIGDIAYIKLLHMFIKKVEGVSTDLPRPIKDSLYNLTCLLYPDNYFSKPKTRELKVYPYPILGFNPRMFYKCVCENDILSIYNWSIEEWDIPFEDYREQQPNAPIYNGYGG